MVFIAVVTIIVVLVLADYHDEIIIIKQSLVIWDLPIHDTKS